MWMEGQSRPRRRLSSLLAEVPPESINLGTVWTGNFFSNHTWRIDMKTCINGATTMPYPLQEDVRSASRAGFDGIEIWKEKLDNYLRVNDVDALKRDLAQRKLGVAAICPFGGYFSSTAQDFSAELDKLKPYLEIAHQIGCESLLVCGEKPSGMSLEKVQETTAERITNLAELAAGFGVKVALEWFWPLREAVRIIESSHENAYLMVDTFHWYRGDGDLASIESVPASRLCLIHINDSVDKPRQSLADSDRVYCGRGVIPLVPILRILKDKGYSGYLSVELFREEYWKRDIDTICEESMESLRSVMEKASL